MLVYRGVSTAEIDVPVSVLADRLGASVLFVGTEPGVLPGVEPSRDVVVDVVAADAALPDWLVVPGGLGWRRVIDDRATMAWLAKAGTQARGVLAISTGSLLLASAGLLDGLDATGHWLAIDDLERLGAHALRRAGRRCRAHHDGVRRAAGSTGGRRVRRQGVVERFALELSGLNGRLNWPCAGSDEGGQVGALPGRRRADRRAPRRPTHPTHRWQSTQSTHAAHATQRGHRTQATVATHHRRPTPNTDRTLPTTPVLPAVATLPATPALPLVAIDPATPMLPTVAMLPATPMLPAAAIEPATAMLPDVPELPMIARPPQSLESRGPGRSAHVSHGRTCSCTRPSANCAQDCGQSEAR